MLRVVVRGARVFVQVEAREPDDPLPEGRSSGSDSPWRLNGVSPSPLWSQSNVTGNSL